MCVYIYTIKIYNAFSIPAYVVQGKPHLDLGILGQFVDQYGIPGKIQWLCVVVRDCGRPDAYGPVIGSFNIVDIVPGAAGVDLPFMDLILYQQRIFIEIDLRIGIRKSQGIIRKFSRIINHEFLATPSVYLVHPFRVT